MFSLNKVQSFGRRAMLIIAQSYVNSTAVNHVWENVDEE